LTSHQNGARGKREAGGSLQPSEITGGGKKGDGGGNGRSPEEAVKAALLAGAVDESQREIFTRVEEVAVTTETTERFVEHRHFQLEYVIMVSIYIDNESLVSRRNKSTRQHLA